jgi:hypothetical protein
MGITAQAGSPRSLGLHQLTLSFLGSVSSEAAAPLNIPRRKFGPTRNDGIIGGPSALGTSFSVSSKLSIPQCPSKRRILRSTSEQLLN